MNTYKYRIADFYIDFLSSWDFSALDKLEGFQFFKTKDKNSSILKYYANNVNEKLEISKFISPIYEFDFEDEDIHCKFYRDSEILYFTANDYIFKAKWADYDKQNKVLEVFSNWELIKNPSILRFSLWMAFNIAVIEKGGMLIHSSVNVCENLAILCLGESGTGKSTHTRLWRENIEGVKLLNDDSPLIFIKDSEVYVSGTPWSGKTPCYINEIYKVKSILRIVRAKENKAINLNKINAFVSIYPSCPPAFQKDKILTDKICSILSVIIEKVEIYTMNCLPNADAAKKSYEKVFSVSK